MSPISNETWETMRPRIKALYIDQHLTGRQTLLALRQEYNIQVSITQLNKELELWPEYKKNRNHQAVFSSNQPVQFTDPATSQRPQNQDSVSRRTRPIKNPTTSLEWEQLAASYPSMLTPDDYSPLVYKVQESLVQFITKYVRGFFDSTVGPQHLGNDADRHRSWQSVLDRCQVMATLNHNQRHWLPVPKSRKTARPLWKHMFNDSITKVFKAQILENLSEPAKLSNPHILPEFLAACFSLLKIHKLRGSSLETSPLQSFITSLRSQLDPSSNSHQVGFIYLLGALLMVPSRDIYKTLSLCCDCTIGALKSRLNENHPTILHARTIYYRHSGMTGLGRREKLVESYAQALYDAEATYNPSGDNPRDERILWVLTNYAKALYYDLDEEERACELSEHLWHLTQPPPATPLASTWEEWTLTTCGMVEAAKILTLPHFVYHENMRKARPELENIMEDHDLRVLDLIQFGMLVIDENKRFDAPSTCVKFLQETTSLIGGGEQQVQNGSQSRITELSWNSARDDEGSVTASTSEPETESRTLLKLGISKLRCEPIHSISKSLSAFDKAQLNVERWIGGRVDWSPLPTPDRYLSNVEARLMWEYGGNEMSIGLDAAQYARYRDRFQSTTAGILPVAQSTSGSTLRLASGSNVVGIWSSFQSILNKALRLGRGRENHAEATVVPVTPASTIQTATQKESYFCTDRYWTSVKQTSMYMVPSIDSLVDDYELFVRLKSHLATAQRSWFRRLISTRTCTQVQLSKFTFLFNGSDIVKAFEHEHGIGTQTPDLCKGYEYSCIPDLDTAEHMQLMAETILQGLQDPGLGRGGRAVLTGIPKLECPPGLVKKQYSSGWGFYTRQGLSVKLIVAWVAAVASFGVAFIPMWLGVVDVLDVQTSLAPLSALTSILSLVLTIGIGIEALASRS